MATALVVATRRAFPSRGGALLRPRAGASSAVADGSGGRGEARGACHPASSSRRCLASFWPTAAVRTRLDLTARRFSSASPTTESGAVPRSEDAAARAGASTVGSDREAAAESSPEGSLPPLTEEEYDPQQVVSDIQLASRFNQGQSPDFPNRKINRNDRHWDYEFVRSAVDNYQRHLQYVLAHLQKKSKAEMPADIASADQTNLEHQRKEVELLLSDLHPSPEKCHATHHLLMARTLASAVRALARSRVDHAQLSQRVRDIERLVGRIGWTPITEELSYRLLEANGKAGNVRRTLALLELRRRRGYVPREPETAAASRQRQQQRNAAEEAAREEREADHWLEEYPDRARDSSGRPLVRPGETEFLLAIGAIKSAQTPLRRARNIYLPESAFPETNIINPTRYLDSILLNMSQRGVPLTPFVAARMLACYASIGWSPRAFHYFYKIKRDPVEEDGFYIFGPHPMALTKAKYEEWKKQRRREGKGRMVEARPEKSVSDIVGGDDDRGPFPRPKEETIRMVMHPPPPFYKIPSAVKGQSLTDPYAAFDGVSRDSAAATPQHEEARTKYEWEVHRGGWSPSLTAAFAFADSLTHGACGHPPIELDVAGWNCLIKACCHQGAFHRGIRILEETMPQKGVAPNVFSYNALLSGLARVGDVVSLRSYLTRMTNEGVPLNDLTVQRMTDGLLNVGDIAGAVTLVQDMFNQHGVLPPYTTHLKILEFALANALVSEAKRHVYFIQQLWKWRPSSPDHNAEFCAMVYTKRRHPKLSKAALQKLFRYFHWDLTDEDFF